MKEEIELPAVMDMVAASGLLEDFLRQRGHEILVEAGQVQRCGAQCLQILLAARAAWVADGQLFLIQNPSDEFTATLELMGISPGELGYKPDVESGEKAK
ncbi:STAS domain-containing protein [Acidocella sp.]|uniref:STAS domain-containing protein n=1 Tax=Acidocella sp. TaxID=50710 RepID=UPI003D0423B9